MEPDVRDSWGKLAIGLGIVAVAVVAGVPLAGMAAAPGAAASLPYLKEAIVALGGLAANFGASRFDEALAAREGRLDIRLKNHDLHRVSGQAVYTVVREWLEKNRPFDAKVRVAGFGERWNAFRPELAEEVDFLQGPKVGAIFEGGAAGIAQREFAPELWNGLVRYLTARTEGNQTTNLSPSEVAAISEALAREFAPRFATLLRSDQRAFNGTMLYLQTDARQAMEGVRADLRWLRNPQPEPSRFVTDQRRGPKTNPLLFKSRILALRGRKAQIDAVAEAFEKTELQLLLVKLTGKAGTGKSRLALEIAENAARSNWNAGFLDCATPFDWAGWRPSRDTLLAVDYVSGRKIDQEEPVQWVRRLYQNSDAWERRVVLILIDREADAPFWKTLEEQGETDTMRDCGAYAEISLDDLSDAEATFDGLFADEIERRAGAPPTLAQHDTLERTKPRLKGQYRPLFALLAALAVLEGKDGDDWTPEELVKNVLVHEFRHWKEAGVTEAQADLLVLATMTGGTDPGAREGHALPVKLTATYENQIAPFTDRVKGFECGPMAPDLIGEMLVLRRLDGHHALEDAGSGDVRARTRALWRLALAEDPLGAGDFLVRTYQDYHDHRRFGSDDRLREMLADARAAMEDGANPLASFAVPLAVAQIAFFAAERSEREPHRREDYEPFLGERIVALGAAMGLKNALGRAEGAGLGPLVAELGSLASAHPEDAAVRLQYAQGLFNATNQAAADRLGDPLLAELRALASAHPEDAAVRENYAQGLTNALGRAEGAGLGPLVAELGSLASAHPGDAAVRLQYAQGLTNALGRAEGAGLGPLVAELGSLASAHPEDAAVRLQYAQGLKNALGRAEGAGLGPLVAELRALAGAHPEDAAVRLQYAQGLFNATNRAAADRLGDPLLAELRGLASAHPGDASVREEYAKGLKNALGRAEGAGLGPLVAELRGLAGAHPEDAAVRGEYAQGLFNATNQAADRLGHPLLAELGALAGAHPGDAAVRGQYASGLGNATLQAGRDPAGEATLAELRRVRNDHPDDPRVANAWLMALGGSVLALGKTELAPELLQGLQDALPMAQADETLGATVAMIVGHLQRASGQADGA